MAYEKADIAEDHKMNNDVTKQKEKKKKMEREENVCQILVLV